MSKNTPEHQRNDYSHDETVLSTQQLLPANNNNNSKSKQQSSAKFEKLVAGFLNAKYSNRPKIPGQEKNDNNDNNNNNNNNLVVEPDMPGGAHLVVQGGGQQQQQQQQSSNSRLVGNIFLGPKTAANPKTFSSSSSTTIEEALKVMKNTTNIVGIVNCTTHVPCYFRGMKDGDGDDDNNNNNSMIKYCVVPVYDEDNADLQRYFIKATDFMHQILTCEQESTTDNNNNATITGDGGDSSSCRRLHHRGDGGNVLVHCEAGVSRSSSIVMAYLIRFHGLSRDEAYVMVKQRRPKVNPNNGFWEQLKNFELQCKAEQQQQHQHDEYSNHPATGNVLTSAGGISTVVLETSMQEQIQESNLLYTTTRDIMHKDLLTKAECFQWLFPMSLLASGNKHSTKDALLNYYQHRLMLCMDFIWKRGVLNIDLEWLVFCCCEICEYHHHHHQSDNCDNNNHKDLLDDALLVVDASDIQNIVEYILNDPESEFVTSRDGNISPRQIQKVMLRLDEAFRGN